MAAAIVLPRAVAIQAPALFSSCNRNEGNSLPCVAELADEVKGIVWRVIRRGFFN